MKYQTFRTFADKGTLTTNFDPNTGIVVITMQVNGVSVIGQADLDNEGIYALRINEQSIPKLLNLLTNNSDQLETKVRIASGCRTGSLDDLTQHLSRCAASEEFWTFLEDERFELVYQDGRWTASFFDDDVACTHKNLIPRNAMSDLIDELESNGHI